MHERKDKYGHFDMKFDSAKDLKKKTILVQNFITKTSSNSLPPSALSLS